VRRLAAAVVILLAATVLSPAGVSVAAPSGAAPSAAEPASVPSELLVGYQRGVSESRRAEARRRANAQLVDRVVEEGAGRTAVELVRFAGADRSEAMRRFTSNPNVSFAEPNWVYTHDAASTDPYFTDGRLWGMSSANPFGSQAADAWLDGNTGDGSGPDAVWVGIIDEGYQYTHPDLADNAGKNPGEIAGNGIDDDGNGKIDDVFGWDFDGNNNSVYDGTMDDHGTHVAGTIGAEGGEVAGAVGVAGVVWDVKLLSAKFLGRRGGTSANAVKAVDYFTDLKKRHGINLVATNNSWGGGGFSQALFDAISRANTENILFVAAAGNDGRNNDTTASYPSGYNLPNVISVAAIDKNGAKASWSNYGATSVDLGAPGVDIWSTLPGGTYGSYNGTSMATPHVTGATALYASVNPGATAASIKSAILGKVAPTAALSTTTLTGGRLDVSTFGVAAVAATIPSAPLGLRATGGDGEVVLTWQPPAENGGAPIDSYRIYRDGGTTEIATVAVGGALTYPDRGLANGTERTYTVRAVNTDAEVGSASEPVSATPSARTMWLSKNKKKNLTTITVHWTGYGGTHVDVHRGEVQTSELNDGTFAENWRGSGTVTYTVCETDSTVVCIEQSIVI
jgi:subtilisin family serine protease